MDSVVDLALAALLDVREVDAARPRRAVVEHVLTAGYAEALELEVERLRVAQDLERALANAREPGADADITELRTDLEDIADRLETLRERLAEINRRFGPVSRTLPASALARSPSDAPV